MDAVWILVCDTESGDHYQVGAWKKKPTEKQIREFMKESIGDDYDEDTNTFYVYWRLEKFRLYDSPKQGGDFTTV